MKLVDGIVAVLALTVGASAQQFFWQFPVPPALTTQYFGMTAFADYNGDGCRDYLRYAMENYGTTYDYVVQIVSGLSGTVLWSTIDPLVADSWHAGDVNGDGHPDIAMVRNAGGLMRTLRVYSPWTNQVLWQNGPLGQGYGRMVLGDVDVNGDGLSDVITASSSFTQSSVYVYDHTGLLLYSLPFLPQARIIISLCKLGDVDNDGGDDFVVAANDGTDRGVMVVVSGRTGATVRESFGLLAGDRTSEHASNFGDLDGDGVSDYGAFPYWSALRDMAVAYSGRTGALLRSWPIYGNSVVTGEDFDHDGVPDVVYGADYTVSSGPPPLYGSTRVISGRDGTEVWRVDNAYVFGGPGSSGWMDNSASLGVQPGSPYPVVAWFDREWWLQTTLNGRIRSFGGALDGQGPVTGVPCNSGPGPNPLIGARKIATGARITIARAQPNALALLCLSIANHTTSGGLTLPLSLTPYGLPGCILYVPPEATYLCITGATGIDRGYAAVDQPWHFTSAATGVDIAAQWLVLDPATGAYATTQRHQLRAQ